MEKNEKCEVCMEKANVVYVQQEKKMVCGGCIGMLFLAKSEEIAALQNRTVELSIINARKSASILSIMALLDAVKKEFGESS
jgi:hypothetical protein